jgi:DNA-directed RNA polymerase specialized sigma24 family protein
MKVERLLTGMQAWAIARRLEGDSNREAAERIGVTEQAIEQRLRRARKRLSKRLAREQLDRYIKAIARPGKQIKLKSMSLSFATNV